MARLYLETSIFSYLAADSSRDLITAGNQRVTHDWWDERRHDFELCVSEVVLSEARQGDPVLAARRQLLIGGLSPLEITDSVIALAEMLVRRGPLPPKAAADAYHIAVAAVHAVDYLMTWNCKHIANAKMLPRIRWACESKGYTVPSLCTPIELMGR